MSSEDRPTNRLNILTIPVLALWAVSLILVYSLGQKSVSTVDVGTFHKKLEISQHATIQANKAALRAQNRARSTLEKLRAIKNENNSIKDFLSQKIPPEIVCVGLNGKRWINGVCK